MTKKTGFLLTAFILAVSGILNAATITINTNNNRAAISPFIYGTDQQMEGDENLTNMRLGGNRMTGYNWENNASNAGSDWQQSSDDYMCYAIEYPLSATECANSSGGVLDHWVDYCNGRGYKSIITLPMAGYVAADKNGTVSVAETAPSARWKQVIAVKGSAFQDPPNTSDNFVYDDEEVYHLVHKYGNATTATGVMAYQLDNEADIWNGTHPRIHPTPVGAAELVARSVTLSAAVKNVDPNAQVFGPVFAMIWSENSLGSDWPGIKTAGGYSWYVDYYLDQMSKASATAGKRLLDAIDIHYYSEQREGLAPPFSYSPPTPTLTPCRITDGSCTSTAADNARMQSPRTLWDSTYTENSSVGQWLTADLPLLPKIQSSINKYYPGTKIAITEHGFGGGSDYSGGICIADVLGIFGKYGVYQASMWKTDYGMFHSAAYKLYRNYDGANSTYGDTMVYCESNDVPNVTCYASINGSDDSTLHIILLNKAATAQTANVNITTGQTYTSANAKAYAFDASSYTITARSTPSIAGNVFSYSLPAHSAFHFIIKSGATPTNTPNYTTTATKTITRTITPTFTGTQAPNWSPTGTLTPTQTVPVTILNTCDSITYNGTLANGANSAVSINTTVSAAITQGAASLKVDITGTGTSGWNDTILYDNGLTASTQDWSNAAYITMDVYVDPANMPWQAASAWHQLDLFVDTVNGKYYRTITTNQGIVSGMNHLTFPIDWTLDTADHSAEANPAALASTDLIQNFFLVLNSDPANLKTGVFYVDNIALHAGAPSPTPTFTPTVPLTPTYTPTFSQTSTPTGTPTYTSSATQTVTKTSTRTYTPTNTFTATFTESPVYSPTETMTGTPPTATTTGTITQTVTETITGTDTPVDTATYTRTISPTFTPTFTATTTATPTRTGTRTPSVSPTRTATLTCTPDPSIPTATLTPTPPAPEITPGLVYPVPYNPDKYDLHVSYVIPETVKTVKFNLYTSSFRLIRSITWNDRYGNFTYNELIKKESLSGLASGTYLYVIWYGENGNENRTKIGLFTVLR